MPAENRLDENFRAMKRMVPAERVKLPEDCNFVLRVGNRRLFERKQFEEFRIRANQFSEEMLEIEARLRYDGRAASGRFL